MIIKKFLFFIVLTTISISYAGKPIDLFSEEDINIKINLFINSFASLNKEIDKYSKKNPNFDKAILDYLEKRLDKLFVILDHLKQYNNSSDVKSFNIKNRKNQLRELSNKLSQLYGNSNASLEFPENSNENSNENSDDDNSISVYQNENGESFLFYEQSSEDEWI